MHPTPATAYQRTADRIRRLRDLIEYLEHHLVADLELLDELGSEVVDIDQLTDQPTPPVSHYTGCDGQHPSDAYCRDDTGSLLP